MRELNVNLGFRICDAALDAALKAALPGKLSGLSSYGPPRPISIWMDDSAAPADDTSAQAIAAAHDPVFLAVDKDTIQANNADSATVTISAPRSNAASVSILVNGSAVPVTLSSGVGTIQISSADPQAIAVSVQNPANRSTDQFTIQAV